MESSVSNPMTFLKALVHFIIVGFVLLAFIYTSFFGLVSLQANSVENKLCERDIAFGATVSLDAEAPTEPCSRQIWRAAIFWAAGVFFLSLGFWIPFVLLGASVWQKSYLRHFQQRRTFAILFIFLASLIPSFLTTVILFYKFPLSSG